MREKFDDASILRAANEATSMADLRLKLSFSEGGSQTRIKQKLLTLGCKVPWLLDPAIKPSTKVLKRKDIELRMVQNLDGTFKQQFIAKLCNKQTGKETVLGHFGSFEKARVAITKANPQRTKRKSKAELQYMKSLKDSAGANNDVYIDNLTTQSIIQKQPKKSMFSDEATLRDAISHSYSLAEATRYFSHCTTGSNLATLRKYVEKFNIDTSHFRRVQRSFSVPTEILKANTVVYSSVLRRLIIANNLIPYVCKCSQGPLWMGEPLTLQLDHKNGDRQDNRIENLEFLCPSCHSQTLTFGSKNSGRKQPPRTAEDLRTHERAMQSAMPRRTVDILEEVPTSDFQDAIKKRTLPALAQKLNISLRTLRTHLVSSKLMEPAKLQEHKTFDLSKSDLESRLLAGETITSIAKGL